jgi:pyruvate,water dikinase
MGSGAQAHWRVNCLREDVKNGMIAWVRPMDSLRLEDVGQVGGKNASLGELIFALKGAGIRIPDGFAVTTSAFHEFIARNNLAGAIRELNTLPDSRDPGRIRETAQRIRGLFRNAKMPPPVKGAILDEYRRLVDHRRGRTDVAVRSSATTEDLPGASFAGQQDSFLNVQGEEALIQKVQDCFASLYNDRAIAYRSERGFDSTKAAISVGVQAMVRADLASSGVMFTLEPESGDPRFLVINSAFGLGEPIVQGALVPDEFVVFKPTLAEGFRPLVRREFGDRDFKRVYSDPSTGGVHDVPLTVQERDAFSLTEDEALELGRCGIRIENHYSRRYERPCPMDIEWAKDGLSGELFVVQARPETVHSNRPKAEGHLSLSTERYFIEEAGPLLVSGKPVGQGIRCGIARVIDSVRNLELLRNGEILITAKTDPDWEPVLQRASAIVTEKGGRTCHAAIMARELGIPAVVGASTAQSRIRSGQWITVSTVEGEVGKVYEGQARFRMEKQPVSLSPLKTRLMLILSRPDEALRASSLPQSGVGLARMEFIIGSEIGIHPMALTHPERLQDNAEREAIARMARGHPDPARYFVHRLSEGIGRMASAFFPKPVIVRMSDFKSSEYSNLIGGREFESVEENPMLGFRGSFRYSHPEYREGFALECEAIVRARIEMGLTNIAVMIPFCRTLEDARSALQELGAHGLRRENGGLQIWMMCEIPSNVILAREFLEHFDGFSIGSNDLTQLVLGVDRDSERLAPLFSERDPAVLWMIRDAIQKVHACGKQIGLCGQGPSDDPEFARFLVDAGIDSISLNPDSLLRVLPLIESEEARLRGMP